MNFLLQLFLDERTVVPFQDPSLPVELRAAVVEEPVAEEEEVAIASPLPPSPAPSPSPPPPQTSQLQGEGDEFSRMPQGETIPVHVKRELGTFGMRIAGGKGKPFGGGFIYIKTLVKDSPADRCGKLRERDIIMKVR